VEGSRVDDVTTHPALAANVAELARQYDKQFDPRFADSLTYVVPATGERAAASLMPAVDAAGLKRRGAAYRTQAEAALGLMGRSSHFMHAVVVMDQAARWANRNPQLVGVIMQKYSQAAPTPAAFRTIFPERLDPAKLQIVIDAASHFGILNKTHRVTDIRPAGLLKA
jgi:aromatic ring hydroxylase